MALSSTKLSKMGHGKDTAVSSINSHGVFNGLDASLRRPKLVLVHSPLPTMATIHPSRLGLVPQDAKDSYEHKQDDRQGRSLPRNSARRSPSRTPSRDRGHTRNSRGPNEHNSRDGDRKDVDGGRKARARADDYFDGDRNGGRSRGRERSRSADIQRDREREERRSDDRPRRPSPEYSEYKRPSPPHASEGSAPAPWRQQENMYPSRRGGMGHSNGSEFLDRYVHFYTPTFCVLTFLSRRQQREASNFSIWPSSPKAPARSYVMPCCNNHSKSSNSVCRSLSPDPKRHKKSKKRRRDSSVSSDTDSEDERRRRERKERKKSRKEKEKYKEKERRHRRSRSRSPRRHNGSEEEIRPRRSKHKSRTASEEREASRRSKTRTKSPDERPLTTDEEDQWVEKPITSLLSAASVQSKSKESMGPPAVPSSALVPSASALQPVDGDSDDDADDDVGPQPLKVASTSRKVDERQYGGALLRGEGSAMAAFLKDGIDLRIPRRGEIGLTSDEIATFESVGYVMSGSRHRRMNAVRMRKENQVISAEEKRGILQLQKEERERREAILREEFQELLTDNLKSTTK